MRKAYRIIAALLCVAAFASAALAASYQTEVHGGLELSYASFAADENGTTVVDSTQFFQQYSLLVEHQRSLFGGRGGDLKLGLGYMWTGLDLETLAGDQNLEVDKLLYNGDLRIAPGGVPFTLHAFSRDLTRSVPLETEYSAIFPGSSRFHKEVPGIYTNVADGVHRQTGVTLNMGQPNGRYAGVFRDLLAAFPMFIADYSEIYVEDLETFTPVNYRERNLAFVSLNKHDNWLHYRVYDYEDLLDPTQDAWSRTLLLGTVDEKNRRLWINLTNWIQLSTDGSVTDYMLRAEDDQQQLYDLNLFTVARRNDAVVSFYGNYQRKTEIEKSLEKHLELPLYGRGELSSSSRWAFDVLYDRVDNTVFAGGTNSSREDTYVSAQLENFRKTEYRLITRIEAEQDVKEGVQDGDAARLYLGLTNSGSASLNPLKYDVSYSALLANGNMQSATEEARFTEHVVELGLEKQINASWRNGGNLSVTMGQGDYYSGSLIYLSPRSLDRQSGDSAGDLSALSGNTLGVVASLFASHVTGRVRNRLDFTYDYLDRESVDNAQYIVSHRLDYSDARWRFMSDSEYIAGSHFANPETTGGVVSGAADVDASFIHTDSLHYSPSRNVNVSSNLRYRWRDLSSGSEDSVRFSEEGTYRHYSGGARPRVIYSLSEELGYEYYLSAATGNPDDEFTIKLSGAYYPIRIYELSGHYRYLSDGLTESDAHQFFLETALQFSQMRVALNYMYGVREGSYAMTDRDEQRFEVSVKRTF